MTDNIITDEQTQTLDYHEKMLRNMSMSVGLGFKGETRFDSNKPGAIAKMYVAFCELEKAKLQTKDMQEKLSWLEYELNKND